jgi:pSer/pThr/pTyr-binding forkhead associated (FHA) protein
MLGTPAPAAVDATAAPAAPAAMPAPDVSAAPVMPAAPAAPALVARLIVEADNQEFDLSGKDNVTIGREDAVSNIFPDVDLTPHGGEEGGVSRLHARLFVENGQYMLEDENSTNFTFLNRQRLAGKTPTPLHDNDEIKLGRVLLRFKTP